MNSVWKLPRNDVPAAVAFVREHMQSYGRPPHEDEMAVLLQLQDDPTELEQELAKLIPGASRQRLESFRGEPRNISFSEQSDWNQPESDPVTDIQAFAKRVR